MEVVGISVEVRKFVFLESDPDISGFTCIEMKICWQGSVFILFSYDTAMYENELIKSKEDKISNKSKI